MISVGKGANYAVSLAPMQTDELPNDFTCLGSLQAAVCIARCQMEMNVPIPKQLRATASIWGQHSKEILAWESLLLVFPVNTLQNMCDPFRKETRLVDSRPEGERAR